MGVGGAIPEGMVERALGHTVALLLGCGLGSGRGAFATYIRENVTGPLETGLRDGLVFGGFYVLLFGAFIALGWMRRKLKQGRNIKTFN